MFTSCPSGPRPFIARHSQIHMHGVPSLSFPLAHHLSDPCEKQVGGCVSQSKFGWEPISTRAPQAICQHATRTGGGDTNAAGSGDGGGNNEPFRNSSHFVCVRGAWHGVLRCPLNPSDQTEYLQTERVEDGAPTKWAGNQITLCVLIKSTRTAPT
jgi:hypothetical protein